MTDRSLIEISDDILELDDLLYECGGDVSDPRFEEAITKLMAELNVELEAKADNYCALITTMEGRAALREAKADFYKGQYDRIMKLSHADTSNATFLRTRLKKALELHGIKKLVTERYGITVAKHGGKLPLLVDDDKEIPKRFKTVKYVWNVDNDAIRKALESGETLDFACFGERGTRLSIK